MQSAEVTTLTKRSMSTLMAERRKRSRGVVRKCQRKTPRWPFPGTVQLWTHDGERERLIFATSLNLSSQGIGLRCEEPLECGDEMIIAVHEPEISFQGRAVVRHCRETDDGWYHIGLQFIYDAA